MKNSLFHVINWAGRAFSLVITTLIVIFSLMPSENLHEYPSWIPFADKGMHVLAYAGFGFCFFLAFAQSGDVAGLKKTSPVHLRTSVIVLISGTFLGFVMELMQPLFERNKEGADLVADCVGVVFGIICAVVFLIVCELIERRVADERDRNI